MSADGEKDKTIENMVCKIRKIIAKVSPGDAALQRYEIQSSFQVFDSEKEKLKISSASHIQ